jgi:integrase
MAQFYISSTKCAIQERQTKKNGKVYDVVFRIVTQSGEEKQKKLSGFKSKTLARQAHTDFITNYCEHIKNSGVTRKAITAQKEIPTVGTLFELYIKSLENQCKESTIYDRTCTLKKHVLPKFADCKIDALTKEALYQFQDDLWASKHPKTNDYYSYASLKKIRAFFSSFLYWVEERYNYPNNFKYIKIPKKRKSAQEMEFWTRDEFQQFIECVDNEMYHALFTILYFTGRRKGEIFALSPQDIKGNTITFNKSISLKTLDGSPYKVTTTKADKSTTVPICAPVRQELQQYTGQSPFFFGGDKPLAPETVRRKFNYYCEKANVKPIRLHDLRHSFVSLLVHNGAPLTVVADLISDRLEQVTKTYAHLYETDKIAVINRIN